MRFEYAGVIKNLYNRFGQGRDSENDYNPFSKWQDEGDGYEYSTLGPGNNEGIKRYAWGEGAHKIHYVHYLSPDILLVHQSKMVGFYLKVGESGTIKPVDRVVKDRLIKHTNIPRPR